MEIFTTAYGAEAGVAALKFLPYGGETLLGLGFRLGLGKYSQQPTELLTSRVRVVNRVKVRFKHYLLTPHLQSFLGEADLIFFPMEGRPNPDPDQSLKYP
jgi:hypothetical protein